jgi:tetratricopeptide (TPR) repeat protein
MALFAISFAAAAAPAQSDPRFDAARAAYDEGRFADALALYDELTAAYPRSPEAGFNRGNTLARLGRIGAAIAEFQRVLLLAPRDADARANLSFLRNAAGLPKPKVSFLDASLGALSASEWKMLALAAWWLGAAALVASLLLSKPPKVLSRAGLALLLIALAAASGWGYWQLKNRNPAAVVVASGAKARFAPLPDATPHFDAPEGVTLRVLEESGDWLRVREDRREGWIPRHAVQIVALEPRRSG